LVKILQPANQTSNLNDLDQTPALSNKEQDNNIGGWSP